jgi:UDP-glucose 4-epimerase
MNTVLVTGGSGYIGTTLCMDLVEAGYEVFNIDLNKKDIPGVTLYNMDFASNQMHGILRLLKPHVIIHLAGENTIGDSISDPERFYINNVQKSLQLMAWAREADVKHFIFTSSAAVYGHVSNKCTVSTPLRPQNVYGRSKMFIEKALYDYSRAYSMNVGILRLFNVAGADLKRMHGYVMDPAKHLMPIVAKSCVTGNSIDIYGENYNTSDGTCLRDYVHLLDVSQSYLKMITHLENNHFSTVNVASGESHSVKQVIKSFEQINNSPLKTNIKENRLSDVHKTYASIDETKAILSWEPVHSFNSIVESEWSWATRKGRRKQPKGAQS